jgi:2-keto-3-deoxy-L-rhamnonate aldolase RhmA
MRVKEKLLSGQKVYGTMIRVSRNPAVCRLAKNAGLDFIMYDCEQSSYGFESLHDLFVIGNALGLDGLLRVPVNGKAHVSRSLDCGALGVMAPMLEDANDARELVKWSKFPPLGERGYGAGGANTDYVSGGKHAEVMVKANATVLSIAQIETKKAVDNAEAMAAVPGVDVLLLGPNDLSVSLGIPGDLMNPMELEAIAHVAACCHKHGKFFGLHGGLKLLEKFKDHLNLIMTQSDTDILAGGFARILADCKAL